MPGKYPKLSWFLPLLVGGAALTAFAVLPAPVRAQDKPAPFPLETDMVFIPGGAFVFGTDKTDAAGRALEWGVPKALYQDEHPRQNLFLKGFYIDRHEVTQRRYKTFVDAVDYFPPPGWDKSGYPAGTGESPVVGVNWYDAANFCDWAEKRLPAEKEWERAARGADGREYPWGNEFRIEAANLSTEAGAKTDLRPVGSFPSGASPEGVQDLIGNVWEWVADDYVPYAGTDIANPDAAKKFKVLRGQSAAYIGHFPGAAYTILLQEFARSGYRQFADPDEGAPDVGFRCASDTAPAGFNAAVRLAAAPPKPGFSTGGGSLFSTAGGARAGLAAATVSDSTFNPFQPKSHLPAQSGIMMLVVLSFLAGLFSFLSPCTLPILPAYFAVTAQAERARMTLNSLSFFCGLAALFVIMGASASFLGGVLRDYLNQLTVIGGLLVLVFGVMTLFGKGFSGANFRAKPATTIAGFFLFGATFALGWTPCVGPILSGILILAASDRTIFQGMTLLFFYALGLGLPLIMIAAFCSKLSKDGWFWRLLRGKGWTVTLAGRPLLLHSTNLASGLLLILLGAALANGYLTYFNSLIPMNVQLWFSDVEEAVVHWFS